MVVFYKNGVHLEGFPIFYNGSHDALALISDLLDGYFPRQLEKSDPDGVPLELVDRLDEAYDGKAVQPTAGNKIMSLANIDEQAMRPVKKEDFLKLIPESMTKDGKIIQVRKAVEERLAGGTAPPKPTKALKNVIKDASGMWVVQNEYFLDPKYQNSAEVSILKVRIDSIEECLICHISKHERIQDLHTLLTGCLVLKSKKWKIINGFPRTEFSLTENKTLEDLELYPRAAIFLQEAD